MRARLIRQLRAFLFPVFNWGQAGFVVILISALGLIAISSDPLLALYIGVGTYIGMVVNSFLMGLAPDEIAIEASEVGPISMMLNSAPFLEPVEDGVWSPSRYKSCFGHRTGFP